MDDLETQVRALADRRFATTSPVKFTGQTHPPPNDRRNSCAITPIEGTEMTVHSNETTRPQRNWYLLGAAAALVAIVFVGIAFVASDNDPAPATDASEDDVETGTSSSDEVAAATAFWEALAAGDRDAALGFVKPGFADTRAVSREPGRAHTLEGQLDWYEAVDWQWTLEGCVMRDNRVVECTVTGSNAWSDALGLEPVSGDYLVQFDEGGIVAVRNGVRSFASQGDWGFGEFAEWVRSNHPDDAAVMFDFGNDVNSEILALYEVNTERFVEAQQDE